MSDVIARRLDVEEPAFLASVGASDVDATWRPALDAGLVRRAALSASQYDTVRRITAALQREEAFLLGDGTGTGKTRILAGVAIDFARRRGHGGAVLWLSANLSLGRLAQQEAAALAPDDEALNWTTASTKRRQRGTSRVFFTTYSCIQKAPTCDDARRVVGAADAAVFVHPPFLNESGLDTLPSERSGAECDVRNPFETTSAVPPFPGNAARDASHPVATIFPTFVGPPTQCFAPTPMRGSASSAPRRSVDVGALRSASQAPR